MVIDTQTNQWRTRKEVDGMVGGLVSWLLSGTNSMTLVVGKSRTNEQPLLQPWTSCHWGFGHAVEHMRKEQLARGCRVHIGSWLWVVGGGAVTRPQSNSRDSNDNNTTSTTTGTPGRSTSKTAFHISRNFHCNACLLSLPTAVIYGLKY